MAKNILIFSDGTGQAGGLLPDETRSNVYKLFRATRCGPDTRIDPERQLAFYDPGIGSPASGADIRIGWSRTLYNLACQVTGLGITTNIRNCYAAIVRLYRPGDRIYLFGFSRGAYTVRCLAGVLGLCGVPTQMRDGAALRRDPRSAARIAAEAVESVYQFGSSIDGDPLRQARLRRAAQFRAEYGSDADGQANVVPYFVGVWDTVATLEAGWLRRAAFALCALAAQAVFAWLVASVWSVLVAPIGFTPVFAMLVAASGIGLAAWYAVTHLNLPKTPGEGSPHLSGPRMRFYDDVLDPRIPFACHAVSIDENRADFANVPWDTSTGVDDGSATAWLRQVWFAGDHSDVGGGYPENESRLSDIALQWMCDAASALPDPIDLDAELLRLFPSSGGEQHDEARAGLNGIPEFLRRWLRWRLSPRRVPDDAPLHPSVIERFERESVPIYDIDAPYRPEALRTHRDVEWFYQAPEAAAGEAVDWSAEPYDDVPAEWLERCVTLEEAEAENLIDGQPFGDQNDAWEALKGGLQEGDDVWAFVSPPETWRALAGRMGVAVIRDGRIVASLVTMMS